MFLIATMKHKGFYEEQEVRFLCLNRCERRSEDGSGYHNMSPYPIEIECNAPRLKIDFPPQAIKKIIIGPQLNQSQKEILLRFHLELYGYRGVSIVKSSAPYVKNVV